MNEILKQDMETLIKLQEAESEIVRLKVVLDKVEKEKQKIGLQLKTFATALEANREDLLRTTKGCRDLETEIQLVDDRIIKSNEKLRMVKTNKEYQLLLREVDDNKKRKDTLETELIEYMEEREKIEKIVDDSEKEFELLKDKIEAEQEEIGKKTSDDKILLDEYLERKADIGNKLDPALMTRFSKISNMNKGLAVTHVKNEVCMGCFMNIPPQLYIDVQRGNSLISCPQCSRILYYINS
ncbi:MAG: C4-type zinc ribbon domain-containing protein [Pseudomonadota bacterium]